MPARRRVNPDDAMRFWRSERALDLLPYISSTLTISTRLSENSKCWTSDVMQGVLSLGGRRGGYCEMEGAAKMLGEERKE